MSTQIQAEVSSVLQELKFECVPDQSGRTGGPQELRPTEETVAYLQSLVENGQRVVVDAGGNIRVKSPK